MFKTLEEILKRKQELRSSLATLSGEALDKAVAEVEELDKQQTEIEKRNSIMKKLASSEFTKYNGISEDYALPNNHNSLSNFGWSSFFPNKVYSFAHSGSSSNGYDYVDFLEDRYKNNLPLRLLAYEMPKNIGSALNNAINKTVVKIIYDDFVLVEKFEYSTDVVGDIPYSVNFQEFNANIVRSSGKDTAKSIMATASVNMVTNAALKASGLL